MTEYVAHPLNGARIVSLAPELSLDVIGTRIPVIEMPPDMPYPTLTETAYILALIAQQVMHRPPPKPTIERLGDHTRAIPNLYKNGQEALQFCTRQFGLINPTSG